MSLLLIILHVILLFSGVPLFVMIASATIWLYFSADLGLSAIIIEMNRGLTSPALIAIPLFTFAGFLVSKSNSPKRIIDFAQALLGWLPAGMSIVVLILSSFFTAFTGASGVTIIAIGGLSLTALQQVGFQEKFRYGFVTTCGSLGLLFAPSLPIILYGLVASVNVDQLFKAGLLPGLLLILILYFSALKHGFTHHIQRPPFNFKNLLSTTWAAKWELPLPVIILYGIYSGKFSATEASAVAAMYAFIMEVIIYQEISIKDIFNIPKALSNIDKRSQEEIPDKMGLAEVSLESMLLIGSILIILAAALGLTSYLIDQEIPEHMFNFIKPYLTSKISFLLALNFFLLIVGMMMDIFSAIIVVVPLILPIATKFGINPVHLGIIFLCNLEIGFNTPPVGLNLFIAAQRFKKSIMEMTYAASPFTLLLILALLIITYVPELSLWFLK